MEIVECWDPSVLRIEYIETYHFFTNFGAPYRKSRGDGPAWLPLCCCWLVTAM